jgi:hypothetical protein
MKNLDKVWWIVSFTGTSGLCAVACHGSAGTAPPPPPPSGLQCEGSKLGVKNLYWGDLHVHTSYSFDAYFFNSLNGPKEAFAFARGAPSSLPCGDASDVPCLAVKLDVPLDFTAVTDHSELMGGFATLCGVNGSPSQDPAVCALIGQYVAAAAKQVALGNTPTGAGLATVAKLVPGIADTTDAWGRALGFADEANQPCAFTAFSAYEYTAAPNGASLHRNIVFNGKQLPKRPVSSLDVANEWEMWTALDAVCAHDPGCDYVSIPHSSNGSAGRMFQSLAAAEAAPVTQAQAEQRARADVLVEVMQNKGESECGLGYQNVLSADEDSACGFEKLKPICTGGPADPGYCRQECQTVATDGDGGAAVPLDCSARLDLVRDVLVEGLRIAGQYQGVNPYKLGLVGSTDTHNGDPGNTREDGYRGHAGVLDDAPTQLLGGWDCADGGASCALTDRSFDQKAFRLNPGGLTGAWAEENTRDALFAALKRREVYATSGTRIAVKLYAAWGALPATICADLAAGKDPVEGGAAAAVPMGADLPARAGAAPQIVVRAVADPILGTPLGRIEIIKGWVDAAGQGHTRVFLVTGAAGGPAPDAGCAVQRQGQPEQLCGLWSDPTFDASQSALYYGRVLENPSCRWSTWMCLHQQVDCATLDPTTGALPAPSAGYEGCCAITAQGGGYAGKNRFDTIEERAWTSPVWYHP